MSDDVIAAISTGLVPSGVAVIRLSGKGALNVAEKMFKPSNKICVKDFEPNKMYTGEILCEDFNDFGLCVYFKSPKSYTGEDSVEFHSHGGVAIAQGVLKSAIHNGARLAKNGEFTRRAFINGKLSLSSCEGLIDMINGESIGQVKAGYYLYREKLCNEVNLLQQRLLDAIAEIDVDMDFPEEDLEVDSKNNSLKALKEVKEKLEKLIASYRIGRNVKNGVKVGIVGKPNTGKSSIFNLLLNYDKAIVSDVAGTTRDIVEGNIDIDGIRFYFSDTAGIRDSSDRIETLGVELSKKVLNESDLIIFVTDCANITEEDKEIYNLVKDKNTIIVSNKIDLKGKGFEKFDIALSTFNKEDVYKLRQLILDKTVGKVDFNSDFLCEERHFEAFNRALQKINDSISAIDKMPLDMIAVDVRASYDALGEITGKTATEDIIDSIFKKFCVGK